MKHLIQSADIDPIKGPFKMKEFTGEGKVGRADVLPLCAQLALHPELWNAHKLRTAAYASPNPHTKVDDIWVRYNAWSNYDPANPAAFFTEHDSTWYPAYDKLQAVRPLIFGLMNLVAGERLGGVLITRIPPGSSVGRHKDVGWHAGYYNRKFAVMLASNHQQAFCFDGESMLTEPGEVFEFDNGAEHWVRNDSDSPRMTLICCIRTTEGKHEKRSEPPPAASRRKRPKRK